MIFPIFYKLFEIIKRLYFVRGSEFDPFTYRWVRPVCVLSQMGRGNRVKKKLKVTHV
ncbi:hypothetical protein Hanom_Chr16g01512721 [Helianthus anomalus]